MSLGSRWLQDSGGLVWHLRALRYRNRLWQPFCTQVASWLADWQPHCRELLIVGPSAGYSLNASFLARWQKVSVIEPDPLARWLLRRRFPQVTWHFETQQALASAADLQGLARRHPEAAILFSNVLGQLAPDEAQAGSTWRSSLRQALRGRHWASYHDVASCQRAPDKLQTRQGRADGLESVLGQFWHGGELEIVDHGCFALGSEQGAGERREKDGESGKESVAKERTAEDIANQNPGSDAPHAWCVWTLRPGQYHLVEWVSHSACDLHRAQQADQKLAGTVKGPE